MNERAAYDRGFICSCGLGVSAYASKVDTDRWAGELKTAKQIKKQYSGADYVIVTGTKNSWFGQGSKAIYGNEVFSRLWYECRYGRIGARLDNYANRRDEIVKKYEAELTRLEADRQEDQRFIDWMNSIKKY